MTVTYFFKLTILNVNILEMVKASATMRNTTLIDFDIYHQKINHCKICTPWTGPTKMQIFWKPWKRWELVLNPLAAEFFLVTSNWHRDNYLHLARRFFHVDCLTWTFFGYSCFPGWQLKLRPYLQYRVSVYTQFLKWRTSKFNFHSYVLNLA